MSAGITTRRVRAAHPLDQGALDERSLRGLIEDVKLPEIETDAHILITWAENEDAASDVVHEAYPQDKVTRVTKRPRNTWVISKSVLGIRDT